MCVRIFCAFCCCCCARRLPSGCSRARAWHGSTAFSLITSICNYIVCESQSTRPPARRWHANTSRLIRRVCWTREHWIRIPFFLWCVVFFCIHICRSERAWFNNTLGDNRENSPIWPDMIVDFLATHFASPPLFPHSKFTWATDRARPCCRWWATWAPTRRSCSRRRSRIRQRATARWPYRISKQTENECGDGVWWWSVWLCTMWIMMSSG